MFSFKRSVIALVGLLVIVGALATLMPLVGRGQGQAPFGPRKFYLTQTKHTGGQALTACAAGYHMASLWEIHDPSNLRYDTLLGVTQDDSGFGPPSSVSVSSVSLGWIRTGHEAASSGPGRANCQAWTSANGNVDGSVVELDSFWQNEGTVVSPWLAHVSNCDSFRSVWCVQD